MTTDRDILKRMLDEFTCDDCGALLDSWCGKCYRGDCCCCCPDPVWVEADDFDDEDYEGQGDDEPGCYWVYLGNWDTDDDVPF